MNERLKKLLIDFEKSLNNLKSAVSQANDELTIDGTIKRFELTYELAWKTMKRYLEDVGIIVNNPRDAFKQAFQNGLIKNHDVWVDMIESRNLLVHTYNFDQSRDIFNKIKDFYLEEFYFLLDRVKSEYESSFYES